MKEDTYVAGLACEERRRLVGEVATQEEPRLTVRNRVTVTRVQPPEVATS